MPHERVLPGNIIYELENNDRIIGGINKESSVEAAKFYKGFVSGKIHKTNARTAEMCKLVENSSRDAQIAFANELSMICDKANIDVWELIELANKHPRVNILSPGCGVGGHCIAVDPNFIITDYPKESVMIKHQEKLIILNLIGVSRKFEKKKKSFTIKTKQPKVAILGLSFTNIDDLRENHLLYTSQIN